MMMDCLEVGSRFLNRPFDAATLRQILDVFISDLGLRRANKLCRFTIDNDPVGMAMSAATDFVQTS
jgi:hypothetical protein